FRAAFGDEVQLSRRQRWILAVNPGAEYAMNYQIRIAANGRSEVCIAGSSEREMTTIFGAVARLFERTQHQVTEDALFRLALNASDELLIVARRDHHVAAG